MKIIFLSHTHRNSLLKVGSSHLARELSYMGHEIMFISTPISAINIVKNITNKNNKKKNDLSHKISLRKGKINFEYNQRIIDYVPFSILPYSRVSFLDNIFIALKISRYCIPSVNSILRKYDFQSADLVLMDDPSLAFMKAYIKADKWIYRMTDIYSEMPKSKKSILEVEKYISTFAHGFIATSAPVAETYRKNFEKKAKVFENGVDYDFFQGNHKMPIEYENDYRKKAVYIGNLDNRLDWNMVYECAKTYENISFYMIGPITTNYPIKDFPENVKFLGSKPYKQIPSYLKYADIGLLPLVEGQSNGGRSPMKLYEYGAAGLPVISTFTPELERRELPFVLLSKNRKEFKGNIGKVLASNSNINKIAREVSKEKSWKIIARDIIDYIDSIE